MERMILIIILNITKAQMPNGNIRIIFMSILVQRSRSSLFATRQRVDAQGNPTVSGHVKSYKIYTGDSIDALKQATDAQPVAEGSFDN